MSEVETVYRNCSLCEAHCGVAIEVDRAKQQILSIRGDHDDPQSRGYICPKAIALRDLQEDPDRLRGPMERTPDGFREISWDDALDSVAARLREIRDTHGPNSIATYLGNPNAHDFGALTANGIFIRALGTRWRFSATSVDQLPKMMSSCLLFGNPGAFPIPDVDRTDFLVILGANPLVSNGSLLTAPDMRGRLRRIRERGGRIVVVDPRRSETAKVADRHLAIRPGTDAFLLLAMVHVLFDEELVDCGRAADFVEGVETLRDVSRAFPPERVEKITGIEHAAIRELTRDLAAAPSAAVYGRIGTCTQEFGTLASWLVDVLNTLTGNLDREGGVMFPWPAHASANAAPGKRGRVPYARWHSRVRGLPEFAGELPVATLAEEIDTPGDERIRALVTSMGNPVLSTPNAGRLDAALDQLDFMVSLDIYLNETTRHADFVLPTTSVLERPMYDMAFMHNSVRNFAKWSPATLPRPEGALHPWELLLELAARLNGTTREAIEDLALQSILGATTGPDRVCADVSPDTAKAKLEKGPGGPARMLDARIRSGPEGDRYDDDAEGLSLEKLARHEHGLDLGPLEPRLPEMLATASGKVELAPDLLLQDVDRLLGKLEQHERSRDEDALLLIGRRQVRDNNSWLHNARTLARGRARCTLQVHPDDAARLGLTDGREAHVESRVGAVVAPVEVTDSIRAGVVSLPHGFGHGMPGTAMRTAAELQPGVNSNLLADEQLLDELSGNAVLNGIPVRISAGV